MTLSRAVIPLPIQPRKLSQEIESFIDFHHGHPALTAVAVALLQQHQLLIVERFT